MAMSEKKPDAIELNRARTPEERKEQARMAGIASGKARREHKTMQEIAKLVLDMPYEGGDMQDLEGLNFEDFPDANLTVGQRATLAVAKRALKGDFAALTFLRDTAGEKPAEKVEVSGDVEGAAKRIQDMISAARDGGK